MKKHLLIIVTPIFIIILLAVFVLSNGYNNIQRQDENVNARWSEVINQYQRRDYQVPNLVNTLRGYIEHENKVLVDVTNARAKVGSMQINTSSLNDLHQLIQFQSAQNELSSALSRLIVVSERYPELKASGLFQNLQTQLEGTENRITVARSRYVKSVEDYNILIRSFPSNLTAKLFSYQVKPNFTVDNEKSISKAPTVDFSSPH